MTDNPRKITCTQDYLDAYGGEALDNDDILAIEEIKQLGYDPGMAYDKYVESEVLC